MGRHLHSFTVLGASRADVEAHIASWLRSKGFEPVEGTPLFESDPSFERTVLSFGDEQNATVAYSELVEEDRLLFELKKLGRPVLELWLHDSDVWGYELWEEDRIVSAFHSRPRYFGPETPPRGPNDVERLCATLGRPEQAAAVRSAQAKRSLFADDTVRDFARCLGLPGHDGLFDVVDESAPSEVPRPLRYARADDEGMETFDASALRFHVYDPDDPTSAFPDLDPAERRQAQQAVKIAKAVGTVLGVVLAPVGLWAKWKLSRAVKEAAAHAPYPSAIGQPPAPQLEGEPLFEQDGDRLYNRRHGSALTLARGARVEPTWNVAFAPSEVFRFFVGDAMAVCVARTPGQSRQMSQLGGLKILNDDLLDVGGRQGRHVGMAYPGGAVRHMVVVPGPKGVYWMDVSWERPPTMEELETFLECALSLRFE